MKDIFNKNDSGNHNIDEKKKNKILLTTSVVMILIGMLVLSKVSSELAKDSQKEVSYNEFIEMVENDEVKTATIALSDGDKFIFTDKDDKVYETDNPKSEDFKLFLLEHDIEVKELATSKSPIVTVLSTILPIFIYVGIMMFFIKRMIPGNNQEEIVEKIPNVTFDDIAGQKELKKDLQFVIEFLKNPKKYSEIGARMPKGIILYGPPGTGKTLTAKAIAGTAGVPFFSMSGSDFVELYVGMGAKRVRGLYKKAKQKAPCIVFIDEIDAVGSSRGINGNSEKDQTVNALLNELDGFSGQEGIITICATNRLEDLDKALIRPGRFDKQLAVPLPEKDDRIEIIKVHTRGKKIAEDVNFDELATMTVGFSGASIEALLNEAAFIAVNEGSETVHMSHVETAFYKMVMKGDKKTNQNSRDKEELRIVAYHEAGHAVATKLYTHDSVAKVTIVSYTSGAGGATFRTPQEMGLYSKNYIRSLIKIMYAGRASENIILESDDEITTGASNDIEQATALIKQYLSAYGMNSNIGMINTASLLGNTNPEIILQEASKLSIELYEEVKADLEAIYDCVDEIAKTLLKEETISETRLDEIIQKYRPDLYIKTEANEEAEIIEAENDESDSQENVLPDVNETE